MFKFLTKFLDLNQKEVDGLKTKVARVNSFTDNYKKLKKAEDLAAKTADFKNRLADGATLDELLPEAFAAAREASDRAIGLRPFDVQLMAATAFHQGQIAEQRTGEGKTLLLSPLCI